MGVHEGNQPGRPEEVPQKKENRRRGSGRPGRRQIHQIGEQSSAGDGTPEPRRHVSKLVRKRRRPAAQDRGVTDTAAQETAAPERPLFYRHPTNKAEDAGPGTPNRAIPEAERAAHVAAVRAQEEAPFAGVSDPDEPGKTTTSSERSQAPRRPWSAITRGLADTILRTDHRIRKLPVNDTPRMREHRDDIPQPLLRGLLDTVYRVSGPADPDQSSWSGREFEPPSEDKALNLGTTGDPSPDQIKVRSWPHTAQWGVHQHDELNRGAVTVEFPRRPIAGIKRKPGSYQPTYKSVDDTGWEYPVNQTMSTEQFYAQQRIFDSSTKPVARADIYIPPHLLGTYKGQELEQHPVDAGVVYRFFETYSGKVHVVRVDQEVDRGKHSGYGGGIDTTYYTPTAEEVTALDGALSELFQP